MHNIWHSSTNQHLTVDTNSTDIGGPHHVSGGHEAALAAIDSAMLGSFSAPRAGLRRIGLVNLNTGREFVVEQGDHLSVAGRGNHLRLPPAHLLTGTIEGIAHISLRAGEGIGYYARGFMTQITNLVLGMIQHFKLTTLKSFVASRSLRLGGLFRCNLGQLLVPQLNRGLYLSATDEDSLLSIGSGDQGIDSQVNTDDGSGDPRRFLYLADHLQVSVVEPHLHQSPRDGDALGDVDREFLCLSTRKDQFPVSDPRSLVGEDHLSVSGLFMRILERFTFFTKRLRRRNSLTEITNSLLHRLRMKVGELSLGLLLNHVFTRPQSSLLTGVSVALHQPSPEPSSFKADGGERSPLSLRLRKPGYFYRAITHV